MTWDGATTSGSNQLALYDDGPNTLLHEAFHHLGLQHTFGPSQGNTLTCNDDDYVLDTPTSLGKLPAAAAAAASTCMQGRQHGACVCVVGAIRTPGGWRRPRI